MGVLAIEIHEACHSACMECPQFPGYDDDNLVDGIVFGDVPKRGIVFTILFWRKERMLWEYGYSECLPPDILKIFDNAEEVMENALVEYAHTLIEK